MNTSAIGKKWKEISIHNTALGRRQSNPGATRIIASRHKTGWQGFD
jgi:hypothetical protein